MPQSGLGTALRTLRERRTLSVRELAQLSAVDHAYVYRLETGEKTKPSQDLVTKLLKVLKPSERDAEILRALAEQPDVDSELVEYTLAHTDVLVQWFTAAAGVRHRGTARPDPATLIQRVKRLFDEEAG